MKSAATATSFWKIRSQATCPWTIETVRQRGAGRDHVSYEICNGGGTAAPGPPRQTIFRMSLTRKRSSERRNSARPDLSDRICALNAMCDAGIPVGILLAPVILSPSGKPLYRSDCAARGRALGKSPALRFSRDHFHDIQLRAPTPLIRRPFQTRSACIQNSHDGARPRQILLPRRAP
jgi:hypothetical protein